MSIKIEFSYLLKSSVVPIVTEISPEDYFTPYENDVGLTPINYSSSNLQEELLDWTQIKITGCATRETLIRTEYFAQGKYKMTYRKDPSGFEEIICNTDIHDNLQHIIIFNKQPGQEIWQSAHNIAMEIKDTGLPAKKTFEKI